MTCCDKKVRHEFCGNWRACCDLSILAPVTVVGQHRRNRRRARAFQGVTHDQKFHEVVIHGRAGGLNDKDIKATNVFANFNLNFTV